MTTATASPADLLPDLGRPAADPSIWPLDPETVFLNHGSFGSCPWPVLRFQQALREHLERQPVHFFVRELEGLLDRARLALSRFLGADPDDLVFVPNATAGVNTVLRSLSFSPGDELVVTNHEYNACRNALDVAAARAGARVLVAPVPFPLTSEEQFLGAVLEQVTERTRLVLADHVTSQTGLVFPIDRLAQALSERGIDLLVDGAHAPGMIPLQLGKIGAAYYTGNCHKWLCAPKGAGFLHVRRDRQAEIRPLSISHGANSLRQDRSRFQIEFGWTGTWDASAFLSIPEAVRFVGSLRPGGWPEVMARNRALALAAREVLCRTLEMAAPGPERLIGSLAAVPLSDNAEDFVAKSPLYADPLQEQLRERFAIEVPVIPWPKGRSRILRVSAQLYNSLPQYELLARSVQGLLSPNQ